MRILPMNVHNVTIAPSRIRRPLALVVILAITIMRVLITFNQGFLQIVQVATVNPVGRVLPLITTTNIFQFILEIIEGSGTAVQIAIPLLEIIAYSVVSIVMNTIIRLN